jgi:putative transposase
MRKKRELTQGAFYHVTSRTNDKIRVFENRLGRKIMLMTLQDAKDKYRFRLTNFCIMPTHFHLLIKPAEDTCLTRIIQWIKTRSAKQWNNIHGSKDHVWGERFFAREIKDPQEYDFVMNYIDQNPVTAGLAPTPPDWKASGAYYKARNISGLVDCAPHDRQPYIKLLSPIPPIVSRLLPPAQHEHTLKYFGAYAETIDKLYKLVPTIPRLGEAAYLRDPPVCLHYYTGTADYFIYEFDGYDTMYGLLRSCVFPDQSEYNRFSLSMLKSNPMMKLDFSWNV